MKLGIEKSLKVKFIVCGAMIVLLLTFITCLNQTIEKKTPDVIEYHLVNFEDYPTVFDIVGRLKESYEDRKISVYCDVITSVTNKNNVNGFNVKVVLTDKGYMDFEGKEFICGSFFNEEFVSDRRKFAVISEEMANKLYKTVDAIGNDIYIFGERYKVTGVYSNTEILGKIASDGYERIFIPYTSIDYKTIHPEFFLIEKMSEKNPFEYAGDLSGVLHGRQIVHSVYNYKFEKKIIFQIIDIFIFVIGILSTLLLIKLLIWHIKVFITYFNTKARDYYFVDIIKSEKKRVFREICKILLGIFGSIIILYLVKFTLYIPEQYIPSDNIFDLKFYFDRILSNLQLSNSNVNRDHISYYTNVIFLKTEIFLFLVTSLLGWELTRLSKLIVPHSAGVSRIIMDYLVSTTIGLFLGILISHAAGLYIRIPIANLIVITCFIVLSNSNVTRNRNILASEQKVI